MSHAGGSRPDLVVVGAGTMGAWTALRAVGAGRRTTLVDMFGPGDPRSTSGDESRIIRMGHGADAHLTRWAAAALDAWRDLEEATGESVFVPAGVAWLAATEDGFEGTSLATMTSLGIAAERLGPDEAATRWPGLSIDRMAFAVHEPGSGILLARRGVRAVARSFSEHGGQVALAAVHPGRIAGGCLLDVVASDGTRTAADAFVFAVGPWLPKLFPEIASDLVRVTKQDVIYVGTPPGDPRFSAVRLPAFIDDGLGYYGIPATDGRTLKVAAHAPGRPFDPDTDDRIAEAASIEAARAFLRARFPELARQPVVETRTCQYESTPDGEFVIDRHPHLENVWLMGGGSGTGFKHGPSIGHYAVSLLDGARPGPEEARFSLARPRWPAGA